MSVIFAVFYVGLARIEEFLAYMHAGRSALAVTNPGAAYVVLTDRATAPALAAAGFATETVAPDEGPLVLRFTQAFQAYCEARPVADLIVLADPDCAANRRLDDALPAGEGLGITVRDHNHRVNAVAYVRDTALAAWFFARAAALQERMPPEMQEWWGDQVAWNHAMGDWRLGDEWAYPLQSADPAAVLAHRIKLLWCHTHNRAPKRGTGRRPGQEDAYMLHWKGDRKVDMVGYVAKNILRRAQDEGRRVA